MMEEQEVKGDEFSKGKKHGWVSPKFIVKLKMEMSKMVGGAQALDIEDDVLPALMKVDEPAPEEEQTLKSTEPDTIGIEKVKSVIEFPFLSPATPTLYKARSVTGVVDQSLTVAVATSLDLMTTDAMEIFLASPRGVSLSWSSAMRALGVFARVGEQRQQQPEVFDVKTAELGVAVEGQHASTPSPKMKEPQEVEDAWSPPKEDDKLSSGVEQESTPLASVEGAAMEEQGVKSHDFPKMKKLGCVSTEFIVKLEVAMSKMLEGAQALDVEDDALPAVVKGNEPAPEEENAPKPTEVDTIVIEKVKGVGEPQSLSPTTSSLYEAGGFTGVLDQNLTVAAAHPLNPMTACALETWPVLPCGVPLYLGSAMRALGVVAQVRGQQQQPEAFDVELAELDVEKHESVSSEFIVKPEAAMARMVEDAQALDVEDDVLLVAVKGDEPAPEAEQTPKSKEPDAIVVEKVKRESGITLEGGGRVGSHTHTQTNNNSNF